MSVLDSVRFLTRFFILIIAFTAFTFTGIGVIMCTEDQDILERAILITVIFGTVNLIAIFYMLCILKSIIRSLYSLQLTGMHERVSVV